MRLAIIGDVHGEFAVLERLLHQTVEQLAITAAVQVGDFGFDEEKLTRAAPFNFTVRVHAICGNRENYEYLAGAGAAGLTERWAACNLVYQPRASVVQLEGECIGFIGGALNMDRPQRRHRGNVITTDEIAKAARLFEKTRPGVIVSHSCPAGIGIGMRCAPALAWSVTEHVLMAGYDPGPKHDCGEAALTRLWREMKHRPRLWCFGHFHVHHEHVIGGTRFLCRPLISQESCLAVWDTVREVVEFHPLPL